jgi:adenylylsulfate kinase
METRWRSIIKAVSWRILATMVTFLVVYFFTRQELLSLEIGLMDALVKIGVYFSHERLWNKIGFGRRKVREDYMI